MADSMNERKRIAVTGASGQLGSRLVRSLLERGHDVVGLTRKDLDVTDETHTRQVVRELKPDIVANCTAYNAVDGAEQDPATAFAVNADGPAGLAAATAAVGSLLVHYSTDFVFDGHASTPYTERDGTNPLNTYGQSKLAGEENVRRENGRHFILRVESLFGGAPRPGTMTTVDFFAEELAAGRVVRAAIDRTVSPSYLPDVIDATVGLIEREAAYGTYHCVASGHATWYDLAKEIALTMSVRPLVAPIAAGALPCRAIRPQFCALDNGKLRRNGIFMPPWQSTLRSHLANHPVLRQVTALRIASQIA
jgi:dTDP-4-dehydrorhamnose reductase